METACKELKEEFGDNIYAKYHTAVTSGTNEASNIAAKWGLPVNRENRAAGGLHWSTYKAICRRNGIYSNAQGPHEWNVQLADPMIRVLASGWEKTFSRRSPAVMASFSKSAGSLLRDFHRDIDNRARKLEAALPGLHMLQQQIRVYDDIFKDLSNTMRDTINAQQKEINREFTPVIERAMGEAYTLCVEEHGSGSFKRMKEHMNAHVELERHTMFELSTEEIKYRLTALVRSVEEAMINKADEVFIQMSRDYRAVLVGGDVLQGECMPKWQRTMRQEVMEVINGCEKVFKQIVGIEEKDEEEAPEVGGFVGKKEDDAESANTKVKQDIKKEPNTGDEDHDDDTEDVAMEDSPAKGHDTAIDTSDDGLPAIEMASEVSKSTEASENTIAEGAQVPSAEEPTFQEAHIEKRNQSSADAELAANTGITDPGLYPENRDDTRLEPNASWPSLDQQLEKHNSREIGRTISDATEEDDSDVGGVGYRSSNEGKGDSSSDGDRATD